MNAASISREGELSPGRSWLARDAAGRRVVLKALEDDCLLEGELHPSIRQRLERVRELAHKQVANLHGVERLADGRVCLVWDFVEGESIAEAARKGDVSALARDLKLAVEALHAAGIVHGAIHEGNVIVDPRGKLWLIDVSPLLWTEQREDLIAVDGLLERIGATGDCSVADDAEALQEVAAIRRRSVLLAAVALAVGLAVSIGVLAWLR